MILEQFYLGCLSQASYLIGDERTGTAAVVDPRRDVDDYLKDARARGLEIRHVFLTHFHADFISGHLELQKRTGARIYLGGRARADYDFVALGDGDTVSFGDVRIQALEAPGHTPESVCYLVFDEARDPRHPHAVLTGDTLFIGDVGRPDLMASQGTSAEELATQLYDSLREKLLPLPDETIVFPAHGAGSMCGKNLSSDTQSTIGVQRRENYALQPMDRETFVRLVTANQPPAPAYFSHDAALNRQVRDTLDETLARASRPRNLGEVIRLQSEGAQVLDTRAPDDFAARHLAGSINIGLDGRYASWAGTVLDPDRPIVVVAEPGREAEAITRLGRVGLDRVEGYLEGGAAVLASRPAATVGFRRVAPRELAGLLASAAPPVVLDVRAPGEILGSGFPGSINIPLPELRRRLESVPCDRKVVAVCGIGYRSTIAASLLMHEGHGDVTDLIGGLSAWES